MDVLVLIVFLYIACRIILEEIVPALLEAAGYAYRALVAALGEVVDLIARGLLIILVWLLRLTARAAVLSARGAWVGLIFLYLLADEWRRGAAPEEEPEPEAEPDDEELHQAALDLLGLPANFTRARLNAAFKKAMKRAHPDAGGTVDQAQAVNLARELLLRRNGWA